MGYLGWIGLGRGLASVQGEFRVSFGGSVDSGFSFRFI